MSEAFAGIPYTPAEFLAEAVNRGHPHDLFSGVSDSMLKAIKSNASMTASQVIAYRAAFFKKWTKRAAELDQKGKELHSTLPKHHQQILRGKRLLLMEDMLNHFGHRDSGIVKEIIQGFDLVGDTAEVATLPAAFQPAPLSLRGKSCHLRQYQLIKQLGYRYGALQEEHAGTGERLVVRPLGRGQGPV